MLLPIRVCVCVLSMFLFLNEISCPVRFLSGHFNFHASSFVFFLFVTKKTEENERKSKPFTKCYIIEIVNIEMSIGFRARA